MLDEGIMIVVNSVIGSVDWKATSTANFIAVAPVEQLNMSTRSVAALP